MKLKNSYKLQPLKTGLSGNTMRRRKAVQEAKAQIELYLRLRRLCSTISTTH